MYDRQDSPLRIYDNLALAVAKRLMRSKLLAYLVKVRHLGASSEVNDDPTLTELYSFKE